MFNHQIKSKHYADDENVDTVGNE